MLVPVADVHRAVAFYAGVLGLAVERVSDEFATLKAGDANLWLHGEAEVVAPVAGVEVWIRVDDVDAVHRRCLEAGIDDLRPPADVVAWGLRVASAPDPDGRRVYLSSNL